MITKEKIIEILKNNSQKSVIGWAVEEDDFGYVAEEIVKNCSIPNVVGQSEQCTHANSNIRALRCNCCDDCGEILDVLD